MLLIGLTGGIGSGKSEVSRILRELGAEIIDADKVGHEAYVPHSETWEIVVTAFGKGILDSAGEIDRKKLGAIIFKDPEARKKLNNIMHPQMRKMIENRIHELQDQGNRVAVLDAALLVEAGWFSLVNEVWVTTAPEDQVIQRLQARNGIGKDEVKRRINAQIASQEREKYADVIIDNSGSWADLHQKTHSLWESRIEKGWE